MSPTERQLVPQAPVEAVSFRDEGPAPGMPGKVTGAEPDAEPSSSRPDARSGDDSPRTR